MRGYKHYVCRNEMGEKGGIRNNSKATVWKRREGKLILVCRSRKIAWKVEERKEEYRTFNRRVCKAKRKCGSKNKFLGGVIGGDQM